MAFFGSTATESRATGGAGAATEASRLEPRTTGSRSPSPSTARATGAAEGAEPEDGVSEMQAFDILTFFDGSARAGRATGVARPTGERSSPPQKIPRTSGRATSSALRVCSIFNKCAPNCEHAGGVDHDAAVGRAAGDPSSDTGESSDEQCSSDEGEEEVEDIFFAVSSRVGAARSGGGEKDLVRRRCAELRKHMRLRPTLPLRSDGEPLSMEDLQSGMKLPLYSCPFVCDDGVSCRFHTDDRTHFTHHIAGGVRDRAHADLIAQVCKADVHWMTNRDYVQEAIAVAERERWPRVGLSTTRRALNILALRYNDDTIQCLACFICAQLRTTCEGYPVVDLDADTGGDGFAHKEIRYYTAAELCKMEKKFPGTLLNNCSYDLWRRRYRERGAEQVRGRQLHYTPTSILASPSWRSQESACFVPELRMSLASVGVGVYAAPS